MHLKYLIIPVLALYLSGCALTIGSKTIKLSFEDTMQSFDSEIEKSTVWEVQGMAHDPAGTKYYIYTHDKKVIYVHPYKKLVYSRSGDIIGFIDTESIIRLHPPFEGWQDIDRTNVGRIANPYEDKYLPDFSTYETPAYRDVK